LRCGRNAPPVPTLTCCRTMASAFCFVSLQTDAAHVRLGIPFGRRQWTLGSDAFGPTYLFVGPNDMRILRPGASDSGLSSVRGVKASTRK
jgi:hypothetical protein